MKIKALVNFTGPISMCKDEEREYSNKTVLSDLLKAGYIKEIQEKDVSRL